MAVPTEGLGAGWRSDTQMSNRAIRDQVQRAVAAFNAGRHGEARRICEAGLRRMPSEAILNHLMAAILFAQGDAQGARLHVEASLAAKADHAPVYLLAGRIARAVQDHKAALRYFDRAAVLAPAKEVAVERARALDAAAMRDAARQAWRDVLSLDRQNREAAARLGRLLSEEGSLAEAAALLEQAVTGDAPASTWFDLGSVRHGLHDLAGAAAAYRRALEKRPDLSEAAVNLGIALQDLGDLDGAMDAYRRAYRLRESTFGAIATSLSSAPHGRLWLDREALRRSLRG